MKISADYTLAVDRESLYAALISADTLRACIPGCDHLEPVGENAYEAKLKIGLPGLKGNYTGRAELTEMTPPEGFTMSVDGKGGPGFVRGTASIQLSETEADAQTALHCEADVQVGGVLAAVGSRLIQVSAKKMMDEFFQCLEARLTAPAPP